LAFAVMADPVSSVAYAIEAALRARHGDLALLLPTMGLVVALIALVISNYHQFVVRFPEGGGAAAAAGAAFGEGLGRSSPSARSLSTSSSRSPSACQPPVGGHRLRPLDCRSGARSFYRSRCS
jgi:amino acid transporter